jgi:hypothetical protein
MNTAISLKYWITPPTYTHKQKEPAYQRHRGDEKLAA